MAQETSSLHKAVGVVLRILATTARKSLRDRSRIVVAGTRRHLAFLLVLLILGLLGFLAWVPIEHALMTGSFFPIRHIETLNSPVKVVSWNEDGLLLEDGRRLQLPDLARLPKTSRVLSNVLGSGVEMGDDGRVYGLVRVHHWCGNDPVGEDIARVDISRVLMFFGEGEPLGGMPQHEPRSLGGAFTQWGWNVTDFAGFKMWNSEFEESLSSNAGTQKSVLHQSRNNAAYAQPSVARFATAGRR